MMNHWQRFVLTAWALLIALLLAYPTYVFHARDGIVLNQGRNWAFAALEESWTIDSGLLLTQILGVSIIGAICYVLSGGKTGGS